jgi:uncharacterized protein (DUF2141 family)
MNFQILKKIIQMKSLFLTLVLICMVFVPKSYSEEANLKINLLNIDKPGVVFLSICRDAAGFEESVENESEEASCVNKAGEVGLKNFEINGMLPYGEYAIAIFVDANRNGKMDKNFLGIPKEQYGFSNNVMGRMAAPSFEQAKFKVTGPTTQNITLRIGIPK